MQRGLNVEGITLWLFGGVSRISSETNSPGTQALFTFVGPLTSLVLGAVFYLVSIAIGNGPHPGLVPATLSWLGYIKDRKSTRLNSSHSQISYAVFCLKKKKISN